jgi:hypothetical protein
MARTGVDKKPEFGLPEAEIKSAEHVVTYECYQEVKPEDILNKCGSVGTDFLS